MALNSSLVSNKVPHLETRKWVFYWYCRQICATGTALKKGFNFVKNEQETSHVTAHDWVDYLALLNRPGITIKTNTDLLLFLPYTIITFGLDCVLTLVCSRPAVFLNRDTGEMALQ